MDEIEEIKPKEMSFSSWVKQACREKVTNETIGGDVCAQFESDARSDVRTRANNNNAEAIDNMSTLALIERLDEKGLYYKQIAERLNELDRESPNNKIWTRTLVRQLLSEHKHGSKEKKRSTER
ncbi:hypothetical protein AB6D15_17650 [Vibrio splendidus]